MRVLLSDLCLQIYLYLFLFPFRCYVFHTNTNPFCDTPFQIKPKVKTVCFGIAASQGALILAGGERGMRFAMPNARIMIHQPQGGCGV